MMPFHFYPVPVRLAPAARPPARTFLAQAKPQFKVIVTDQGGRPFRGEPVTLDLLGETATTDSSGAVTFDATNLAWALGGRTTVPVRLPNFGVTREGKLGETLFIQLPVCAPQPLLTLPEVIAFAAGSAMVSAGVYWKVTPLQIVGEVLFGAAVFTAVYRHSCTA